MPGKDRERLYLAKRYFQGFLNFIFPSKCKICGKTLYKDEVLVCKDCEEKLNFYRFREIKRALDSESILYSFLFFENIVKDFIHLFKYYGYIPVGRKLVEFLKEKYSLDFLSDYNYYLPVPLHKKKLRERGFNQAELISNWIVEKDKIEKFSFLERKKYGISQASLSRQERIKNIKGSFGLKKEIKNSVFKDKNLLIIDDILTTGATFFEIRKVLTPLGFQKIDIMTLSTPREL